MVDLREFQPRDASVVARWVEGPEALVMWSGHAPFSWPFDAGQLLGFHAVMADRHGLVATDEHDVPVGHVMLMPDARHWSARLGMVLVSPGARGRGYGAAMIQSALRIAFEEMEVHRVDLGVYTQNTAAIRLYERLGFQCEGVLREVTRVNDQWWSSLNMSILAHEWPERATGPEV